MTDWIVSCKEFCMRQVRVSGRRYAMYGGCKDGNLLIASDMTSAVALPFPICSRLYCITAAGRFD
jgi:hypothetical protein